MLCNDEIEHLLVGKLKKEQKYKSTKGKKVNLKISKLISGKNEWIMWLNFCRNKELFGG